MKKSKISTALEILEDEKRGDKKSALKKMCVGYSMTWVYKSLKGELFPKTKPNIKKVMEDVYGIQGRQYDIKNIAEGENVVMIELVESYPDTETKKIYRTPLVLILEFSGNKIKKGRHYCDPNLSYLHLTEEQIKNIFN